MPRDILIDGITVTLSDEELSKIQEKAQNCLKKGLDETLQEMESYDSKLKHDTYGYAIAGLILLQQAFKPATADIAAGAGAEARTITWENISEKIDLCWNLNAETTKEDLKNFFNDNFKPKAVSFARSLTEGQESSLMENKILFGEIYETLGETHEAPEATEEDSKRLRKIAIATVIREKMMECLDSQVKTKQAQLEEKKDKELSEEYQRNLQPSSPEASSEDSSSRSASSPSNASGGEDSERTSEDDSSRGTSSPSNASGEEAGETGGTRGESSSPSGYPAATSAALAIEGLNLEAAARR